MVGKYKDDPFEENEKTSEESPHPPTEDKSETADDQMGSAEEMCEKLVRDGLLMNKFSSHGEVYLVRTTFTQNKRRIRYRSAVTRNDKEMEYEVDLLPVERRYALGEDEPEEKPRLYAKEACETHISKCVKVRRKLRELREGGKSGKKTAGPGKAFKLIFVLIILALAGASFYLIFPKIYHMFVPDGDKIAPSGKVTGIAARYAEGDMVSYAVRGEDDKALKRMIFEVKSSSVKMLWNVRGKSVSESSSFSTQGWKSGIYDYLLHVEDKGGNTEEYAGSFELTKKAARPSPLEMDKSEPRPRKPDPSVGDKKVPENKKPLSDSDWEHIDELIKKSE